MADVTLPSLGESVTEGIITQWFKKVGDLVARDEPLFEVSTDKVDSEMPSPAAGVLVQILAEEGDTVETGARVAVIDESQTLATSSDSPAAPNDAAPAVAPITPATTAVTGRGRKSPLEAQRRGVRTNFKTSNEECRRRRAAPRLPLQGC